ncbi:uncharacterized protein LOC112559155 [Pomacea canaliculata]|uniref:uncharacterized protein LOC112559155 n=1 Tax=Pomacea canaliculata TaxID=400727 RepID=UPI000D73944D|nr:uncharacterized protein LOC112559155 [Pomacea canaliculata]XP_025085936.1 uncharacterized protein LOC112559155 [Pomacea canaliculata]XP_025085937.1 uncharacterized protein LOC112559155 [Pomacea canaliculata]
MVIFHRCLKRRVLSFILLLASLVAILFSFRSVVFSPHPRVVVSGEGYGSTSRPDIDTLTQTLTVRLSEAEIDRKIVPNISCDEEKDVRRPCVNRNCTKKLPSSPQERLLQLLERKFQLPVVTYGSVIHRIADNISQQDYIFVTAASSNHFEESRALLKNLRERVFSQLQKYLLVFINLGLNNQEKEELAKQEDVHLADFPFHDLPPHISTLWCYSWKPLIIQALLPKTKLLIYMDSSVRFLENATVSWLFQRAVERGLQFLRNPQSVFLHTVDATFNYYGDQACQYQPFPEILAGFGVYHNEDFVRRAVVAPWASCALVP